MATASGDSLGASLLAATANSEAGGVPSSAVGGGLVAACRMMMSWSLRLLVRMGYIIGVLLTLMIGTLWYFQEKILFHPTAPDSWLSPDQNPVPYQNPHQFGNMRYEDVAITTEDGVELHAWFIIQKEPQKAATAPTIIFFQGNAGNMGFRLPNLHGLYTEVGVNILALHYRGYGKSQGKPSESGLYLDALAALAWLKSGNASKHTIDESKIFLFGRSIGGAVAIDLASRKSHQLRGLIVENTFSSLEDMVFVLFPFLRPISGVVRLVQRLHMTSLQKLRRIQTPLLCISGLKDQLVPPSQMARLFAASPTKLKVMLKIPEGTHNDSFRLSETYYADISNFIQDALKMPQITLPPPVAFTDSTRLTAARDDTTATRQSDHHHHHYRHSEDGELRRRLVGTETMKAPTVVKLPSVSIATATTETTSGSMTLPNDNNDTEDARSTDSDCQNRSCRSNKTIDDNGGGSGESMGAERSKGHDRKQQLNPLAPSPSECPTSGGQAATSSFLREERQQIPDGELRASSD